ncbi:unnamed protein product [Ceratitis capitata]|uniref:(Mediterranean fruit fly) hypothetical protein n=1 Tax=Ceratitis capitata TaxID=7213 RepID=A0A811US25_CERCA|nr:unnamed protein product [Ceratitis capitata]
MSADESAKWCNYTSQLQQAINAHKHSSMKYSQFEINFDKNRKEQYDVEKAAEFQGPQETSTSVDNIKL